MQDEMKHYKITYMVSYIYDRIMREGTEQRKIELESYVLTVMFLKYFITESDFGTSALRHFS